MTCAINQMTCAMHIFVDHENNQEGCQSFG